MDYVWPRHLCNGQGVPYEKMPSVYLEKTNAEGEVIASDTFTTQEAVDQAWADGFHSPGKPETRDFLEPEEADEPMPDKDPEPEPEPPPKEPQEEKRGPGRPSTDR